MTNPLKANIVMKIQIQLIALAFMSVIAASCEKPVIDGQVAKSKEKDANVTLRFSAYGQEPFTRAEEPLSGQLQRLSVAIFRADGTKAKSVNQAASEAGFGTVALQLATGTYRLVAIAHNGLASCTVSSQEKVTFPNNKMTDTFVYCGTLTVVDDIPIEQDITLHRRVAMLRLTLTDEKIPDGVRQLKFYYTGGSSTLNPTTGFGCVNSKQTEYRDCYVNGGNSVVKTYELYTLPHQTDDELKLTVTALDGAGAELYSYVLDNIPVSINKITTWSGCLFGGADSGGTVAGGNITVTLDTEWDGTINYIF